MPGDEVGDQVLFFSGVLAGLAERLGETFVAVDGRLLHLAEHLGIVVLGRDGDLSAGVMLRQLGDELGASFGEVVADAGRDEHLLDARRRPHLLHEVEKRIVIGHQVFADARVHARQAPARALGLFVLAAHLVHVRGRPTEVRDHATKVLHARERPHFAQNVGRRSTLDDAPLVLGDAAERASTEAPAHRDDRMLHRFEGRHRFPVRRVRPPGEGKVVERVHFPFLEGKGGRIEIHGLVAVCLQERPAVVRVGFVLKELRHRREGALVRTNLVVRREHEELAVRHVAGLVFEKHLPFSAVVHGESRSADVAHRANGFAGGEPLRDLPRRALAHAEHQQIGFRVEEHRTPDLIGPVVVVRDAPKRRLDASQHDRHSRERLPAQVGVHDRRAVRAHARAATGRVLIFGPHLLLRGQPVEHRIEVARADADEKARPSHSKDVAGVPPIGLRDDADFVATAFEEASDENRSERGVVDVGVAGDDEDVELVPAARLHLGAGRRQERGAVARGLAPAPGPELHQFSAHEGRKCAVDEALAPPRVERGPARQSTQV